MGIYIKGMEMPKSCYDCPLQDDECFGSIKCCYAKTWGSANMRAVDCPLIPVPDHGDLIDRDKAVHELVFDYAYAAADLVKKLPTIIPAEKEGEA